MKTLGSGFFFVFFLVGFFFFCGLCFFLFFFAFSFNFLFFFFFFFCFVGGFWWLFVLFFFFFFGPPDVSLFFILGPVVSRPLYSSVILDFETAPSSQHRVARRSGPFFSHLTFSRRFRPALPAPSAPFLWRLSHPSPLASLRPPVICMKEEFPPHFSSW